VRAQQACAEAVDRRDPRALGVAGGVVALELEEAVADPVGELARRLLGEGDREDPADLDVVLHDGAHDALDHHARLAAARPGRDQQRPGAILDDRQLLLGEGDHAATLRQIP
jgi:hypothetical protein